MILASSAIGISISTKDRWDDLAVTLGRLRNEGLDNLETVVLDDGSVEAMPARLRDEFPWVRFERAELPRGYIAQRNHIARLLSTPLILGLDDDSFPVAGNLETAAARLLENPKTVALALRVIFRGETPPEKFGAESPFPVRDFIGCANLIKRDIFLGLGGYEERFEFYTEEAEFCLRAMQHGYAIEAFPQMVIQHKESRMQRRTARRARRFARNETLLILWYLPFPAWLVRAAKTLPGIIVRNRELRRHWLALTVGWFEALIACLTWSRGRSKRLTWAQYKAWRQLPTAVQALSGQPRRNKEHG
ncbi:MAG TPA: glycosyltransferase [Candidatus Methylacidiphilales bacterium]|nr:glycosyltransferase [Candidatus Methylacidiphilales bacterium]